MTKEKLHLANIYLQAPRNQVHMNKVDRPFPTPLPYFGCGACCRIRTVFKKKAWLVESQLLAATSAFTVDSKGNCPDGF